jgi:hypothetical protein
MILRFPARPVRVHPDPARRTVIRSLGRLRPLQSFLAHQARIHLTPGHPALIRSFPGPVEIRRSQGRPLRLFLVIPWSPGREIPVPLFRVRRVRRQFPKEVRPRMPQICRLVPTAGPRPPYPSPAHRGLLHRSAYLRRCYESPVPPLRFRRVRRSFPKGVRPRMPRMCRLVPAAGRRPSFPQQAPGRTPAHLCLHHRSAGLRRCFLDRLSRRRLPDRRRFRDR